MLRILRSPHGLMSYLYPGMASTFWLRNFVTHWPFVIRHRFWACLLPVMDVVRTSVYVMGLVIQRHNEFRDAIGDLSALAWGQVCREPIVRESDIRNKSSALVADLVIGGVRSDQSDALLDICVVNTDAQSYLSRSPSDVLAKAEEEKKAKYLSACEAGRALFTPICVSGWYGRKRSECLFQEIGR